jgi:DNA-binding MarR family transcriptional regulator
MTAGHIETEELLVHYKCLYGTSIVLGEGDTAMPTQGVAGRPPWGGCPAAVEAVTENVLELMRSMRKGKARLVADARGDVASATKLLLLTLAAGPVRTSALAASVQLDLSTVSRQAATLVAAGLLERRADPADGRACLLVLTPAGQDALAEHEQDKADFFARVLDGWTAEELEVFSGLLARFTAAYNHVHDAWLDGPAARPLVPSAGQGSLT